MPFTEHFSAWASGVGGWVDLQSIPHVVIVSDLRVRSKKTGYRYFGDYRYGAYLEHGPGSQGFDQFVSLWAQTDPPAGTLNSSLYGAILEL